MRRGYGPPLGAAALLLLAAAACYSGGPRASDGAPAWDLGEAGGGRAKVEILSGSPLTVRYASAPPWLVPRDTLVVHTSQEACSASSARECAAPIARYLSDVRGGLYEGAAPSWQPEPLTPLLLAPADARGGYRGKIGVPFWHDYRREPSFSVYEHLNSAYNPHYVALYEAPRHFIGFHVPREVSSFFSRSNELHLFECDSRSEEPQFYVQGEVIVECGPVTGLWLHLPATRAVTEWMTCERAAWEASGVEPSKMFECGPYDKRKRPVTQCEGGGERAATWLQAVYWGSHGPPDLAELAAREPALVPLGGARIFALSIPLGEEREPPGLAPFALMWAKIELPLSHKGAPQEFAIPMIEPDLFREVVCVVGS